MVYYVYYNPETMQIEAEFNTPNLAVQTNWADKGLLRAIVPDGMTATRDCVITGLTDDGVISGCADSPNPVQPAASPSEVRLEELTSKLTNDSITDAEMREMMRLERGLNNG
jgi:hypothetical protein